MTSVSSNLSLLSFINSISKSEASDSTKPATGTGTGSNTAPATDTAAEEPKDPIGELRKYAAAIVAQSRGGLFTALAGGEQTSPAPSAGFNGASSQSAIQLPDVASMNRDDAASLLPQVQKLIDKGLSDSVAVAGFNGDKQTESLETYRDWLQSKAGISIYV